MHTSTSTHFLWASCLLCLCMTSCAGQRHPVPKEHPRLLGSREHLQELAKERPEAYTRVVAVARERDADAHSKIISMALVSAIEQDAELAGKTVERAMRIVNGPIRKGHVTFGHDLALTAIAYDLCHEAWTESERAAFQKYMNATVDANVKSETHVFHNAWYGYKHWGIGLACYASYYENPRAPEILQTTYDDYYERAAPALELAGDGGGWAEGYYIHYWSYEWLFFCEVARHCEGLDLYEAAPGFYRNRAIASAFEMYPGIRIYGSRRPIPMGDGGGITFGGDRDKALSARRILVNWYRDDPAHQYVHAFNETTPRSGVGNYAYKDFLWRDTTVPKRDLNEFKLSHVSPGPGYVYARSDWSEDATHFFFKCGDRFTAHQHLDVGHFMIYKHEDLASDGGYYYDWTSPHIVDYMVRSIAHSTILVRDPDEKWPKIRGAVTEGNDGGQAFPWPHHNGAVADVDGWLKGKKMYDIGDLTAFADGGSYVYLSGDCTRAYSPKKMKQWVRQIVYIRPGTFVIFDRVASTDPSFRKTWQLQAAKPAEERETHLVVTNGKGRLFVQTLLPEQALVKTLSGDELYNYDGRDLSPLRRPPGPVPECRIQVSPPAPATVDHFLHVLTATSSDTDEVPTATIKQSGDTTTLTVGEVTIGFRNDASGGSMSVDGQTEDLPQEIVQTPVTRAAVVD